MTLLARVEFESPDRLPEESVDILTRLISQDSGLPLPRKRFSYDQPLMKEGQVGNTLYVLLNGQVDVERNGIHIVSLGGKGVFIGEIAALYENVVRTATVKARLGGAEALELSTKDVAGLTLLYNERLVHVTEIISQTAVSRMMTMSQEEMKRSNIPTIDKWFETEDGRKFPPLKIVTPTRLVLI